MRLDLRRLERENESFVIFNRSGYKANNEVVAPLLKIGGILKVPIHSI